MKYLIYRSLGDIKKNIEQHTLVGVEFGEDFYSMISPLMKIINQDMDWEYPGNQGVFSDMVGHCQQERYDYCITAFAHCGIDTVMIDYGIIEQPETNKDYAMPRWDSMIN